MFAEKQLKVLAYCLFMLILIHIAKSNADASGKNILVRTCQNAYQNESLESAVKTCNSEKIKATHLDDSIQELAIVRTLIKIHIKFANHELIGDLFNKAKSLVTLRKERHEIIRDHGIYYYHLADYTNAEIYFLQGLELSKDIGDPKLIAKSLNDIGLINLRKLNYKEALTYLHESLEIKENLDLKHHSAVTIRNIALVYYRLGENEQALKFYLQALKQYNDALQLDPDNSTLQNRIVHINTDLAAVYARLGNRELSKKSLESVYSAIKALNNTNVKISRLIDLAEGLIESKDFNIAKNFLYHSEMLLTDKNEGNLSRLYYLLAKVEYETNNLEPASLYTNTSIRMAEQFKDHLILLQVYKLHADIKEKLGQTASALNSFKKHAQLNHESNKQKFSDDLRQVKFRLEKELNEKQLLERDNALLVSEANNQKLFLSLYTIIALIILIILAFYHRSKLYNQKKKQLNIELKMHKAKLKELGKPLVNFKNLFKDVKVNILICTDVGFLIYSNIQSLQALTNIQNTNIKELSAELNIELEHTINTGSSITTEISSVTCLPGKQKVKITPLMNSDYFIFEFLAGKSSDIDVAGKITIVNRFAQSINSLVIDKKDIGLLRPIIIDAMEVCVKSWIRITDSNKVEFAEQSKIWKVNIDEGRLRTRSLDKYLSINTLPKQPRLKNVIKTCHFVLSHQDLTSSERDTIDCYLNKILAFDRS